ncbi:MAG: hypothetical protein KAU50_08640 [Candidatus Marinimicrobia bacterium]|nr:hypothetical protein [Candidatus Neomarinimicrobiota bacterium]
MLVINSSSGSFEGQIEVFVKGLANKGAFNIGVMNSALLSEIAEHVKAHEGPFYGQLYQQDDANIVFRLLDRGGKIVFKHALSKTGAK